VKPTVKLPDQFDQIAPCFTVTHNNKIFIITPKTIWQMEIDTSPPPKSIDEESKPQPERKPEPEVKRIESPKTE